LKPCAKPTSEGSVRERGGAYRHGRELIEAEFEALRERELTAREQETRGD